MSTKSRVSLTQNYVFLSGKQSKIGQPLKGTLQNFPDFKPNRHHLLTPILEEKKYCMNASKSKVHPCTNREFEYK